MFRLIKFTFKIVVLLKLIGLGFSAGLSAAYAMQLRAQQRTWGLVSGGAERALPGDDLVAEADIIETRALEIEAAPDKVWPWLTQLGYGRGGWYSYPALDRPWSPSGGPPGGRAERLLEGLDELAEGDVVPTHRNGGFVVRQLEPGASLVLYLDDSMSREQLEELVADASEEAAEAIAEMDLPPYAVSWAFVLESAPGDRTRLIERLRFRIDISDVQRRGMPVLRFGVFALMRSQLLGIKRLVEADSRSNV